MRLIDADLLIADILEARRSETDTIPKLIRFIRKQPSMKQKYEGLSVFEESVQADRAVCVYVPTEPKRGRWIQKSKPLELCTYWWRECSVCGNKPPNDIYGHPNYLSPYCPNCGAKMEVDE